MHSFSPSAARSVPPFRLLLFLLLLLLPPAAYLAQPFIDVSGEYNCKEHQSEFVLPNPAADADCLSLLRQQAYLSRFEECKNKVCYLFLQEAPFIILPPDMLQNDSDTIIKYQKPFPCGSPTSFHSGLHGMAFDLHELTSSRDALCVWAGPIDFCTFNALVDFTHVMAEDGYQFAITGLLLETPQRQCHHEPSAPYIDNSMIIIGTNTAENAAAKGPLYQLVRPFRWATWGIFGAVVFLFMLVCFAIAVRFHVLRGRSLVTAFFIFAGERDQAMAYEHDSKKNSGHRGHFRGRAWKRRPSAATAASDDREVYKRNMSFATKYGLSMTLFRISLLAFIAVFALFYEVAVVNFLFQQQALEIGKSVKSLSISELKNYSVLKNSALESVWHATVNPKGFKYDVTDGSQTPWSRCANAKQCVNWVADDSHPISFDVTFEVLGKYLIKQESNCNDLTVFKTKDILYHFNAGWLYNNIVDRKFRKQVDRELVALRIKGTIRKIIDDRVGDFSCTQNPKPDIGPFIILVPLSLFVFPPLLGSILVILCWRTAPDAHEEQKQDNDSDAKIQSGGSESKSSLLELDSTSGEINDENVPGKASDSRIASGASGSPSTLVGGAKDDVSLGNAPDEMKGLSMV